MITEAGFAEQQAFGSAPQLQGQGLVMMPQGQALSMPGHAPAPGSQVLYGNHGDVDGWLPGDEALELQKLMRPKEHGMTSSSILSVGALCFFLTSVALLTCEWRSNAIGVVGYKQHRGWGLFHVVGTKSQAHFEIMQFTCRAYGGFSIGGICNSPICAWYRLKCQVYIQLMWISYSAGVFMVLGLLVHAFCLYWTWKLTPRLIRWAATWWCVAVALEGGAMVIWLIYTEDLFSSLGEKAIYPTPPPGASFALAAVSLFGLITCCILTMILMKIHPESEDDYDSDEEFSDSDDDIKEHAKEFMQWSRQNNDAYGLPRPAGQPSQAAGAQEFVRWSQPNNDAYGLPHPEGQPSQAAASIAMGLPQDQQYRGGPVPVSSSDASGRGDSATTETQTLAAQTHKKATSSTRAADTVGQPPSGA